MDILRFITCGSVDDGKSTLIGRLLYDSQAVSLDILNAIERQTKNKANGAIDLSLLTDGLRAEREQGITIDVAYKYFTTQRRKFIIADAPGHVQYTRNMVTGASNADLAIVLIDARQGVIEQTRRHSLLASLLGIPRIVVAVNKMDLVAYDPSVFELICADYQALAKKLGLTDVTYIPISALAGDNVVDKSAEMATWYTGKTLLEHLETVSVNTDMTMTDARFQVQYVIRPRDEAYHDYRGYAGRIQSGVYRIGDKVAVLPSGITSVISKIEMNLNEVEEAFAGQSVVLHLSDDVDVSRGDSITVLSGTTEATVANELEAHICWFDEKQPLTEGSKLLLQNGTNTVKAIVREIEYKYDVSSLEKVQAQAQGKLNEILKVCLKTAKPIVFDTYAQNRQTGAFILINENACTTVAAGMITGRFQVDDFEI
jgi:sulfate adenylyltransferase subunit 1